MGMLDDARSALGQKASAEKTAAEEKLAWEGIGASKSHLVAVRLNEGQKELVTEFVESVPAACWRNAVIWAKVDRDQVAHDYNFGRPLKYIAPDGTLRMTGVLYRSRVKAEFNADQGYRASNGNYYDWRYVDDNDFAVGRSYIGSEKSKKPDPHGEQAAVRAAFDAGGPFGGYPPNSTITVFKDGTVFVGEGTDGFAVGITRENMTAFLAWLIEQTEAWERRRESIEHERRAKGLCVHCGGTLGRLGKCKDCGRKR
jgi:hypothetical protein